MKLTLRIGAAVGIVALAACSQSGPENNANSESSTEAPAIEPSNVSDGEGPADTLGNQLNQLNESDESGTTTNETQNSNRD